MNMFEYMYSRIPLSRTRLSRISRYLELKASSLETHTTLKSTLAMSNSRYLEQIFVPLESSR
jgi:hypothetical protein